MEDKKEYLKRDSLPSNSHKARNEARSNKEEPKKVGKVVKGKVITRKKSFGKKFVETFVGEDVDNVGSYILYDVLIPAAKSTISEMVQGGIEMLLFGERKGSRTKRDRDRSYVSYDRVSRDRRDDRRDSSAGSRNRARHNFDDIALETRGEAEEVLSHLVDLIVDYGQASVADLYDLVGISGSFVDNKYGWDDLRGASVVRDRRGGYILDLPKTKLID